MARKRSGKGEKAPTWSRSDKYRAGLILGRARETKDYNKLSFGQQHELHKIIVAQSGGTYDSVAMKGVRSYISHLGAEAVKANRRFREQSACLLDWNENFKEEVRTGLFCNTDPLTLEQMVQFETMIN